MELNDDGSMKGTTFTEMYGDGKYKGGTPTPKYGSETYRDYYNRVQECKKEGFHLGDLSWGNWTDYCLGSPYNEECMQHEIIN